MWFFSLGRGWKKKKVVSVAGWNEAKEEKGYQIDYACPITFHPHFLLNIQNPISNAGINTKKSSNKCFSQFRWLTFSRCLDQFFWSFLINQNEFFWEFPGRKFSTSIWKFSSEKCDEFAGVILFEL